MRKNISFVCFLLIFICIDVAFSTEPETIQEAIDRVKSITDPNPAVQDKKRAQEALRIVSKRVLVLNDWSGFILQGIPIDVWNQFGGEGTVLDRAKVLDVARAKGWDLADTAWTLKGGQCDEHASLMQRILKGAGVSNVTILRGTRPHAFPVVNMAKGADPDIPWTWGPDAFIADSWDQIILSSEESWYSSMHFGGGLYFVAPGASSTTREMIVKFNQKGEDFILQHCDEYMKLLDRIMIIPAEVRAEMYWAVEPLGPEVCDEELGADDFGPDDDDDEDPYPDDQQLIDQAFPDDDDPGPTGDVWILESATVYPAKPDPGWSYSGERASSAELTIYNGDKAGLQWTKLPDQIDSNGIQMALTAQGRPRDPKGRVAVLIGLSSSGLESDLPSSEWNAYAKSDAGNSDASKDFTLKPVAGIDKITVNISLMWGGLGFTYTYRKAP